jgi:hypothetical protein
MCSVSDSFGGYGVKYMIFHDNERWNLVVSLLSQ